MMANPDFRQSGRRRERADGLTHYAHPLNLSS